MALNHKNHTNVKLPRTGYVGYGDGPDRGGGGSGDGETGD